MQQMYRFFQTLFPPSLPASALVRFARNQALPAEEAGRCSGQFFGLSYQRRVESVACCGFTRGLRSRCSPLCGKAA